MRIAETEVGMEDMEEKGPVWEVFQDAAHRT